MASLAKQLDKLVADNNDKKFAAVINFLGQPTDEHHAKVADFATKNGLTHVSLTIAPEASRMKLSDQAEVTAIYYKRKIVKTSRSAAVGGLDDQAVKNIIAGAHEILD